MIYIFVTYCISLNQSSHIKFSLVFLFWTIISASLSISLIHYAAMSSSLLCVILCRISKNFDAFSEYIGTPQCFNHFLLSLFLLHFKKILIYFFFLFFKIFEESVKFIRMQIVMK